MHQYIYIYIYKYIYIYICIRTRTVKILQAMSLLLHIVVLSLSGFSSHNSKSLTLMLSTCVVSHSEFTAPYMVYLTVYLCPSISFWVCINTSSDSSLDLSPCIILRNNSYQTWSETENIHVFGALMDWVFSIYIYIWKQNIWEFTMRVECKCLPWDLSLEFTMRVDSVRVYRESSL